MRSFLIFLFAVQVSCHYGAIFNIIRDYKVRQRVEILNTIYRKTTDDVPNHTKKGRIEDKVEPVTVFGFEDPYYFLKSNHYAKLLRSI